MSTLAGFPGAVNYGMARVAANLPARIARV
jgi:hypothetical protein